MIRAPIPSSTTRSAPLAAARPPARGRPPDAIPAARRGTLAQSSVPRERIVTPETGDFRSQRRPHAALARPATRPSRSVLTPAGPGRPVPSRSPSPLPLSASARHGHGSTLHNSAIRHPCDPPATPFMASGKVPPIFEDYNEPDGPLARSKYRRNFSESRDRVGDRPTSGARALDFGGPSRVTGTWRGALSVPIVGVTGRRIGRGTHRALHVGPRWTSSIDTTRTSQL